MRYPHEATWTTHFHFSLLARNSTSYFYYQQCKNIHGECQVHRLANHNRTIIVINGDPYKTSGSAQTTVASRLLCSIQNYYQIHDCWYFGRWNMASSFQCNLLFKTVHRAIRRKICGARVHSWQASFELLEWKCNSSSLSTENIEIACKYPAQYQNAYCVIDVEQIWLHNIIQHFPYCSTELPDGMFLKWVVDVYISVGGQRQK